MFTVHSLNYRSQRAVERLGAVRERAEADVHGRGENVVFRLDVSAWRSEGGGGTELRT